MLFLLRKIGKFLRGSTSPFQIYAATLLAGLTAFTSGGFGSIGLIFLLTTLLIILNANLFVAGICLGVFKLIYWLILPLLFKAGVFLLHGPLEGLVGTLSDLPVFAWFGFDFYVQVPGLFVGLILGLGVGWYLQSTLGRLRRKMASLESDSDRYNLWAQKPWVKGLAWVLFGGLKGKKSWDELASAKKGLPVRPIGIALVFLSSLLIWVGWKFLDTTIITTQLQSKLEQLNGATVDIGSFEIIPQEQKFVLQGIAFADSGDLGMNRFEAETITLNISGSQLLAKRIELDQMEILGGAVQTKRRIPGVLIVSTEEPETPPAEEDSGRSIYDYLGEAAIWKSRLETASRWIERIQNLRGEDEDSSAADGEEVLSWREQLALRAEESGYAQVVATHLERAHPRLLLRELISEPIRQGDAEAVWTLHGTNLASDAWSTAEAGMIEISNLKKPIQGRLTLPHAGERFPLLDFAAKAIPVASLKKDGAKYSIPLESGNLDISIAGRLDPGNLSMPVDVVLNQGSLKVAGRSVKLDNVSIPVELSGSLRSPKVKVDPKFAESLIQDAAKGQIKSVIEEKAGEKLKKLFPFGG